MRRDVLVAAGYADWQATHSDSIATRRRDAPKLSTNKPTLRLLLFTGGSSMTHTSD